MARNTLLLVGGFDVVAENHYNLTASRYKPRVAEAMSDEDPAELIREVLAIEREITAGLGKLLGEVERCSERGSASVSYASSWRRPT